MSFLLVLVLVPVLVLVLSLALGLAWVAFCAIISASNGN